MLLKRLFFYVLCSFLFWGSGVAFEEELRQVDVGVVKVSDGEGLTGEILKKVYALEGMAVGFNPRRDELETDVWLAGEGAFLLVLDEVVAVFKRDTFPRWDGAYTMDYTRGVGIDGGGYGQGSPMGTVQFSRWDEVVDRETAWLQLNLDLCDVLIDTRDQVDRFLEMNEMNRNLYGFELLWETSVAVGFGDSVRGRALEKTFTRGIRVLLESGGLEELHQKWGRSFDAARWREYGDTD